ncbi:MAG TPA: polysaccharide deacetylase family protein, partial [Micromonosporaceae bacterium]
YGILTGPSLIAARRLGLTPVLWTAWGRDWTAATTPESVARTIRRGLRPGGTILLHDSDCTSAPGSSAATVAVLPDLVRQVRARGFDIGPLREHGLVAAG